MTEAVEWVDPSHLMGMDLPVFIKENYGYDIDCYWRNIGILFIIGATVRVFAYLALQFMHREKKQ